MGAIIKTFLNEIDMLYFIYKCFSYHSSLDENRFNRLQMNQIPYPLSKIPTLAGEGEFLDGN